MTKSKWFHAQALLAALLATGAAQADIGEGTARGIARDYLYRSVPIASELKEAERYRPYAAILYPRDGGHGESAYHQYFQLVRRQPGTTDDRDECYFDVVVSKRDGKVLPEARIGSELIETSRSWTCRSQMPCFNHPTDPSCTRISESDAVAAAIAYAKKQEPSRTLGASMKTDAYVHGTRFELREYSVSLEFMTQDRTEACRMRVVVSARNGRILPQIAGGSGSTVFTTPQAQCREPSYCELNPCAPPEGDSWNPI